MVLFKGGYAMKNKHTAKRLQKALSDMNMKPQELAEKSGVSKSSISQYINGSHVPSNISSAKMAKVLNVNPLWLMGFDVPRKSDDHFYSTEGSNLIIEITKEIKNDAEFAKRMMRYMALLSEDKKSIDDMIDFMYSKEHNGEN